MSVGRTGPGSPLHGGRQLRRIEQKSHETLLIFDRKPDDTSFFDRPVRGILAGGDDEIADAATLQLSGELTTARASVRYSLQSERLRLFSLGIIQPLFPHPSVKRRHGMTRTSEGSLSTVSSKRYDNSSYRRFSMATIKVAFSEFPGLCAT